MRQGIALTDGSRWITHQELPDLVDDLSRQLPQQERCLVLLPVGTDIPSALWYLACLKSGNVPILISSATTAEFRAAVQQRFAPSIVIDPAHDSLEFPSADPVTLHPDLAVLLGTSGSTGSGRFVRLSRRNLLSNARSIGQYLPMKTGDIAVTNLPLSYSYGLSVLNSNLLAGHGVALTELAMSNLHFWHLAQNVRATSVHTVPFGFELAEHSGFPNVRPTTLRYATTAGGPMPEPQLSKLTQAGQQQGWQMFAMYGQTEATARMAYLSPAEALRAPQSIGSAIPGGRIWVDAPTGEVGTIKYRGPNVMMGYAASFHELAEPSGPDILDTGDLAIADEDGSIRIVGRSARFAKLHGSRISLDEVEQRFSERGVQMMCVDDGTRLGLVVRTPGKSELTIGQVRELGALITQQPQSVMAVTFVSEFPRLPNGKLDAAGARALLPVDAMQDPTAVSDIYRRIFGHSVGDQDSFNSLGGDSLNYVDASVSLEDLLGQVPRQWPEMTVAQLQLLSAPPSQRGLGRLRRMETSVLIRAISILCIVCSHAGLFTLRGGAHALIALAGYNMARFQLSTTERIQRVKRILATAAAIAIPTMIWISLVIASRRNKDFNLTNIALLNNVLGPDTNTSHWRYWAIEAIVYLLLGTAALMSIPWINRADRRWPFAFPVCLLLLAWGLRTGLLVQFPQTLAGFRPEYLITIFALGWAIARARSLRQQLLVSGLTVVIMIGYFESLSRAVFVILTLLSLIWISALQVPRLLVPVLSALASASLYIYLVHWQVFPTIRHVNPILAVLASLIAGIAVWQLVIRVQPPLEHLFRLARTRVWVRRMQAKSADPIPALDKHEVG